MSYCAVVCSGGKSTAILLITKASEAVSAFFVKEGGRNLRQPYQSCSLCVMSVSICQRPFCDFMLVSCAVGEYMLLYGVVLMTLCFL